MRGGVPSGSWRRGESLYVARTVGGRGAESATSGRTVEASAQVGDVW